MVQSALLRARRHLAGWLTARPLVTLGFFLLYWNRFAGIRSGLGAMAEARPSSRALRPYRDYLRPRRHSTFLTLRRGPQDFRETQFAVTRRVRSF